MATAKLLQSLQPVAPEAILGPHSDSGCRMRSLCVLAISHENNTLSKVAEGPHQRELSKAESLTVLI